MFELLTQLEASGLMAIMYRHGLINDKANWYYRLYMAYRKQLSVVCDKMTAYETVAEDHKVSTKTVIRAVAFCEKS